MSIGYIAPLFLVIICNMVYHLISKSLPNQTNPFLGLIATYGIAFIGSIIVFLLTKNTVFAQEKGRISIFNLLLGVIIIGVEGGYMLMYRAGWEISKASVLANIVLTILLVIVGTLFYKELLDMRKIIGVVLCVIGIVLLNR